MTQYGRYSTDITTDYRYFWRYLLGTPVSPPPPANAIAFIVALGAGWLRRRKGD